jgi:dynein heavy chain
MKRIQDEILSQLVNSTGNILDEEDLISFLEKSKVTGELIKQSMEENEIAQVEIEEARSKYKIVAERGSILYFVIADLAGIDPMYQYSLLYFLRLFNTIIA